MRLSFWKSHWRTKGLVLLGRPGLHFVCLGVVFFFLQGALSPQVKPTVGPLTEAEIAALSLQWQQGAGRAIGPEQLQAAINAELDRKMLLDYALAQNLHLTDGVIYQRLIRNMQFLQLGQDDSEAELFQQAIEMELHLDDEVVKRRLVQIAEHQLLIRNPPRKPTPQAVRAAFQERQEALRLPSRFSFEHVFFPPSRAVEMSREGVFDELSSSSIDRVRPLGAPFLQGSRFDAQTPDQLERNFGAEFVENLVALHRTTDAEDPGSDKVWLGPLRSPYGLHWVWLTDFDAGRLPEFAEVEAKLVRDLEYVALKEALNCSIAALRRDYTMIGRATADVRAEGQVACQ